ncbi:MAG: hypothetical protein Tsb0034_28010 [Ekhidna sp.]
MIKVYLTLILLAACTAVEKKDFTAEEVKEDIQFLYDQFVTYHPGFFRYTPRDSMDHYFECSMQKGTMDQFELYGELTFLISKVKCGHTRTSMTDQMRDTFTSERHFFPFAVKLTKDKTYIVRPLNDQLNAGDIIRSINGVSEKEIRSKIYAHLPSDGTIVTGKRKITEYFYDAYYQLYVAPGSEQFELEVERANGGIDIVNVRGITFEEANDNAPKPADNPLLSLHIEQENAYMQIRTFGSSALSQQGFDYESFLEDSFAEIKEKNIENLILDLRGNGGGRDDYGALLVSYLAQTPFGYFDNIQVTPDYPGSSETREGKHYMTNHKGLSLWQPQQDRFEGNLYVLIDGFCFSTCSDVATVLHHHGWATFIGEETGGGYDGNTSGHSKTIVLPNSRVSVNLPMWMYTTANVGHSYQGRGVIPDYQVTPTWEQIKGEQDAEMELVESLLNADLKPFAPEIFPKTHSGSVVGFSPDRSTMYFIKEDSVEEKLLMFQAERDGNHWVNPELMPFSGKHSDMGGRVSGDGKTIFFTSDRPGGSDLDEDVWNIWKVTKAGNSWSAPDPLTDINNMGNECCLTPISDDWYLFSSSPKGANDWRIYEWRNGSITEQNVLNETGAMQWPSYFDPVKSILFFNSMRRESTIGKDDIYYASYEKGNWSLPVIGTRILNSNVYEDGAILSPDGSRLIFNRHTSWNTPSNVYSVDIEYIIR